MKYFHRTSLAPDAAVAQAAAYFGGHLAPVEEGARRRTFRGALGSVTVDVAAEGGHYTLITVSTDQPGESELDKLARRFLGEVHAAADPRHRLRGGY